MLKKHLSKYVMDSKENDFRFSGVNRAKSLKPLTAWDDKKVAARAEVYDYDSKRWNLNRNH
jgi:hypothetical protein